MRSVQYVGTGTLRALWKTADASLLGADPVAGIFIRFLWRAVRWRWRDVAAVRKDAGSLFFGAARLPPPCLRIICRNASLAFLSGCCSVVVQHTTRRYSTLPSKRSAKSMWAWRLTAVAMCWRRGVLSLFLPSLPRRCAMPPHTTFHYLLRAFWLRGNVAARLTSPFRGFIPAHGREDREWRSAWDMALFSPARCATRLLRLPCSLFCGVGGQVLHGRVPNAALPIRLFPRWQTRIHLFPDTVPRYAGCRCAGDGALFALPTDWHGTGCRRPRQAFHHAYPVRCWRGLPAIHIVHGQTWRAASACGRGGNAHWVLPGPTRHNVLNLRADGLFPKT